MTTDSQIEHSGNELHGRYAMALGEGYEAELTYVWRGEVMVINHTGVPKAFEGQGIALKLVKRVIEDARSGGFLIEPQCPYVALQFRRHPDWNDLQA